MRIEPKISCDSFIDLTITTMYSRRRLGWINSSMNLRVKTVDYFSSGSGIIPKACWSTTVQALSGVGGVAVGSSLTLGTNRPRTSVNEMTRMGLLSLSTTKTRWTCWCYWFGNVVRLVDELVTLFFSYLELVQYRFHVVIQGHSHKILTVVVAQEERDCVTAQINKWVDIEIW